MYHVSFSIPLGEGSNGLDKLAGICTCPVKSKAKAPCKHIVALLLSRVQKVKHDTNMEGRCEHDSLIGQHVAGIINV